MKKNIKEISYVNPWFETRGIPEGNGPRIYQRWYCDAYVSDCGRGMILEIQHDWYDYLINGKVVTQRAGSNPQILEELIAVILDGKATEDWGMLRAKECYEKQ
jgi:hypothetical protein